jgi:hypothetical protein
MGAGMLPLGRGTPNPRPNLRNFSTPASAWVHPINERNIINQGAWDRWLEKQGKGGYVSSIDMAYTGYGGAGKPTILHTPSRQTEAQRQAFNTAESNWARIEAARKKRQEAYEAMAQKSGDVPAAYKSRAGKREAGDPLYPVQAAGGQATAYEPALFGYPRKRREQYRSIVNLRNP